MVLACDPCHREHRGLRRAPSSAAATLAVRSGGSSRARPTGLGARGATTLHSDRVRCLTPAASAHAATAHAATAYAACSGMARMMSESPMSVMDRTEVRNILPQAVPRAMLSVKRAEHAGSTPRQGMRACTTRARL